MRRSQWLDLTILAVLVGSLVFGGSRTAHAGLTVTLTQTGNPDPVLNPSLMLTDTGQGTPGIVVFTGLFFGDFFCESLTITSNSPGNAQALVTDVQTSIRNTTSTGDRQLILTVESTGFTSPGGKGDQMALTSNLSSAFMNSGSNSQATFLSSLDDQPTGLVTVNPTMGMDTSTVAVIRDNPFTLRNTLTLTIGAGGTTVLNAATIAALPEPTTLVLVFSALPVLGLAYYRRRTRA